jgi:hypothetical protein
MGGKTLRHSSRLGTLSMQLMKVSTFVRCALMCAFSHEPCRLLAVYRGVLGFYQSLYPSHGK